MISKSLLMKIIAIPGPGTTPEKETANPLARRENGLLSIPPISKLLPMKIIATPGPGTTAEKEATKLVARAESGIIFEFADLETAAN